MKQIENVCLRYCVPFLFRESIDRATPKIERYERPNGDCVWAWERVTAEDWKKGEAPLFDFLLDSLMADTGERAAVGRCFSMKKPQGRPFLATRFLASQGDSETEVTVSVEKIGLFLTRSRVGFLWYELGLSEAELTQELVVDFQQKLVEANPFAEWVAEWLSPLEKAFLPGREINEKLLPGRPLLYTVASFDQGTEAQMKKTAFALSTGRETDKPSEACLEGGFDGGCFGASEEGLALIFKGHSENTEKGRREFFLLYLYFLYRRYSILFFAERINREISAATEDYERIKDKDADKREQRVRRREKTKASLEKLVVDMSLFLLKNDRLTVSFLEKESALAAFLSDKLRMPEMEAALEEKLCAAERLIGSLERLEYQEEEDRRQEEERAEEEREEVDRAFSLFGWRKKKN